MRTSSLAARAARARGERPKWTATALSPFLAHFCSQLRWMRLCGVYAGMSCPHELPRRAGRAPARGLVRRVSLCGSVPRSW